jgi:hypothetical protein
MLVPDSKMLIRVIVITAIVLGVTVPMIVSLRRPELLANTSDDDPPDPARLLKQRDAHEERSTPQVTQWNAARDTSSRPAHVSH